MNIENYTVNQARSIIRNSSDPARIAAFSNHPQRSVQVASAYALRFKKLGVPAQTAASVDPEVSAAAEKYGLPVSEVLALVAEKGSLLSAKRSLAARKGAATKKAS